jgi:hypothetical protein
MLSTELVPDKKVLLSAAALLSLDDHAIDDLTAINCIHNITSISTQSPSA